MNIAKALKEEIKSVEGNYNGETFTVDVNVNTVTPRLMQRFADSRSTPIEMANALADVIKNWDIDMDGNPFPPSAATLSILPMEFVTYLLDLVTSVFEKSEEKANVQAG
jgi:hypothetical protein